MEMQAFAEEVKAYARLFRLPGFSVAVVENGKILYRLNEGYADWENQIPISDDSIFPIASITKTFTAVMMMQYEQEGNISLEDYLLKYPLNTGWNSPRRITANIQLKHLLSMTSGGVPGTTFSYHGGRYNFLAGVFDQINGRESPGSYVEEVTARILNPLHLNSTRAGYPDKPDPRTPRIVKRYQVSASKDRITKNQPIYTHAPYDWNSGYPASGLLSTIEDLATYAGALDENRLVSPEQYERMTAPFVNVEGQSLPYGYGWFTQNVAGIRLHWAYGYGDSDAALFLRVPDRKLTLLFFSNCAFPSQACRLGDGNVLRSPFALSFLKHCVLQDATKRKAIDYEGRIATIRKAFTGPKEKLPPLAYEELLTQALVRAFMRDIFYTRTQYPEQLTRLLYEVYPEAFTRPDTTLIYLLSLLDTDNLDELADGIIRSYHPECDFRPDTPFCIGQFYGKQGEYEKAMEYYLALVDTPGFEDENSTIEACALLGKFFLAYGDKARGREYLWKAALYAQEAHYSGTFVAERFADLNRPQQEWNTGKLSTPTLPVFTATVSVSSAVVEHGKPILITITARNSGGTLYGGIVDLEIMDATGARVEQQFRADQLFLGGQTRTFIFTWVPLESGSYTVDLGFFGPNWTPGYRFDKGVATITVNSTLVVQ